MTDPSTDEDGDPEDGRPVITLRAKVNITESIRAGARGIVIEESGPSLQVRFDNGTIIGFNKYIWERYLLDITDAEPVEEIRRDNDEPTDILMGHVREHA